MDYLLAFFLRNIEEAVSSNKEVCVGNQEDPVHASVHQETYVELADTFAVVGSIEDPLHEEDCADLIDVEQEVLGLAAEAVLELSDVAHSLQDVCEVHHQDEVEEPFYVLSLAAPWNALSLNSQESVACEANCDY